MVKSAIRSPARQAIERQFSETGQAVRDRFRTGGDETDAERERKSEVSSRPKEILRQRYARGEIDRKQYLEMLDDLNSR